MRKSLIAGIFAMAVLSVAPFALSQIQNVKSTGGQLQGVVVDGVASFRGLVCIREFRGAWRPTQSGGSCAFRPDSLLLDQLRQNWGSERIRLAAVACFYGERSEGDVLQWDCKRQADTKPGKTEGIRFLLLLAQRTSKEVNLRLTIDG